MINMQYDKVNGSIGFLEGPHRYENVNDPSIKYISVTTLIEKYTQPFDKDFWSAYKALESLIDSTSWSIEKKSLLKTKQFDKKLLEAYNISEKDFNAAQQNILDEWQEENHKSCERGTKIHTAIENSFYSSPRDISLKRFGIGGKFECKKDYTELDMEYGIYPEYLISYDNPNIGLHLAGQIDLLVKNGDNFIIGDWKSNKKLDFKGFYDSSTRSTVKMKYPLTSISDCNFNHYQLQLSTYAWMLQKLKPECEIEKLFIYHIDHKDNKRYYEVKYLKDEVEKMLKHYCQQLKIEKQKAKYERIQY